ncbi:MAG: hypothetical protein ACI9GB_003422, partial [Halioglobus sp.]
MSGAVLEKNCDIDTANAKPSAVDDLRSTSSNGSDSVSE